MNFKEFLIEAEELTGGRTALAKAIGLKNPNHINDAKRGDRGLPDLVCLELGKLLKLEHPMDMIAVRNEWLAKTEEERREWAPFAQAARSVSRTAS